MHLTINKWAALAAMGLTSALGYGVNQLLNQPLQEARHLPRLLLSTETSPQDLEDIAEIQQPAQPEANDTPTPEIAVTPVVQVQQPKPLPQTPQLPQVPSDPYPIDQNFFKTLQSNSIGRKYKDSVLLVNANHQAWRQKSQKLIKMAGGNKDGKLWSYWYGYLVRKHLTPSFANKFCRNALSYSEWGTYFTIRTGKSYFDFLWSVCGKENQEKPNGWWYKS